MPDRPSHPGDDPTLTTPGGSASMPAGSRATMSRDPSPDNPNAATLAPGVLIADRYRIVNRLGAGGMGEVWRADDLQLSTSVAIKLLPPHYAADPVRLDRLRAEVRLTRQISHPNVCRVYDIAQAAAHDGSPLTFLCMEFIDGEDLASVLRRLGRPSHEKSVQIARQLCFALAAAHEQGVVHRDLKPANVMLDGRGNVRLTDFGIAGLLQSFTDPAAIRAGTPAYMAPEQLEGREVSRRSDIYSLGLVLYELFTGKPAINAKSIDELSRLHQSQTRPADPSSLVRDLDPAVERVILHCLEHDPAQRPASALAVAAALPGGDPLAAAIAAGETPSPELVAASGSTDRWPHARAWLLAAVVVLMSIAAIAFTSTRSLLANARPEKSLDVLTDRAMETIRTLGHDQSLAFVVRRYDARDAFLRRSPSPDGTRQINRRPGPFCFWLRASPFDLTPSNADLRVLELDPFPARLGEVYIRTDTRGRLERLIAVPPRGRPAADPLPPVDPNIALALAELDPARFEPVAPSRRPPIGVDHLAAFRGTLAEHPNEPILVHVGSVDAKLAYFTADYPWEPAPSHELPPSPPSSLIASLAGLVGVLVFSVTCVVFAILNLRHARADRRGALRAAIAMLALAGIADIARADITPPAANLLFEGGLLAPALWAAMSLWLFYIAFEPAARRVLPGSLVSWSRLLRGGFTDPLVGRHVLLGLAVGTALSALTAGVMWATRLSDDAPAPLFTIGGTRSLVEGPGAAVSRVLGSLVSAVMRANGTLLVVSISLLATRKRWLAFLALTVVGALLSIDSFKSRTVDSFVELGLVIVMAWFLLPVGLVACIAAFTAAAVVNTFMIGFAFSGPIASLAWLPAGALALATIASALSATLGKPAMAR
ncbi:MAG: serine/threonine protein kinase [Phycisphaerae bacterium]|nr:serine/threonine protein kinase [Phycisphaerae bacterium]